jgi:hypothetical protein
MLIVPDKSDLGDLKLSPEEGVAKLKEGNAKLTAQYKLPNQSLLENHDMALGIAMQPSAFIARIQKLNPAILVEKGGVPSAVAVRIPGFDDEGNYVKKYVTGFYTDRILPEFSSIATDEKGLPWREQRGWRSVLLALLKAEALTYPQVKAAFGEPNTSRNVLWREQTQEKRA